MNRFRGRAGVLLGALAMDLAFGEPPERVHPVIWIGKAITALERRAPTSGAARQLAWGGAMAVLAPAGAALFGALISRIGGRGRTVGFLLEAGALSGVFALRGLLAAGREVRVALDAGDQPGGRERLRSLVSRETAELPPAGVAAAAIESLAENLTDSVIAPWLAYLAGGLPGAYLYRAVNTLDSMVGYRGRYEYLGKASARLDDLLNLAPARVTALLITVCAPAGSGNVHRAWTTLRRFRGKTASPNAGWTMSAMAGALGVRLVKAGHYRLGDGREPAPADVSRAGRIILAAAGCAAGLVGVAALAIPQPDTSRFRGENRRTMSLLAAGVPS